MASQQFIDINGNILEKRGCFQIDDYYSKIKDVPTDPGIYVVINRGDLNGVSFQCEIHGIDPNVILNNGDKAYKIKRLNDKWDRIKGCNKPFHGLGKSNEIIYIGKATNLRRRISQYMRYFEGSKGHSGGRAIGQIKGFTKLKVEYYSVVKGKAEEAETDLINEYSEIVNKGHKYNNPECYPLANWRNKGRGRSKASSKKKHA